jgi:DNA-binding protein Fis
LPLDILLADGQPLGRDLIDNFEKYYINKVVANCGGNQARAAELLGLNPNLLASKI